jgi:hypothetical protein
MMLLIGMLHRETIEPGRLGAHAGGKTAKGTARVQNELHEVTNEAHDNEAKAGALCNLA